MIVPRDYQEEARKAVHDKWVDHRSTMVVVATGGGKSIIASLIIQDMQPKRALVIVPTIDLVNQMADDILEATGLQCSIERAGTYSDEDLFHRTPVVVGTIQTLCKRHRMERLKPKDFGLLLIDEMDLAAAPSYRRVMDHFYQNEGLKMVGFTATPKRGDGAALKQVCESVAFEMYIPEAVKRGWLVKPVGQFASVGRLDLSQVHTSKGGDFNQQELAKVLESDEVILGMAQPIIEVTFGLEPKTLSSQPIGEWRNYLSTLPQQPRRGIVFVVRVEQAESMSATLNLAYPGISEWVCGETEREDRTDIFNRLQSGKTPIVCNVQVISRGVDIPAVETIFMAAPTKVWSRYVQRMGRGTRPLKGVVDGPATPEERRAAIAASAKPWVRIVDFCGDTGRHKLITSFDALGGHMSEAVLARAKKKALETGKPVSIAENLNNTDQEIKKEKQEEERKRALVRVDYSMRDVDLLGGGHATKWHANHNSVDPATEPQRRCLGKAGVHPSWWSFKQAQWIIGKLVSNHWRLPAEMEFLKRPKHQKAV